VHRAADSGNTDAVREHWPEGRKELEVAQKTPFSMFLQAKNYKNRKESKEIVSLLGGVC
jgi:hypothetical protein